MSDKKKTMLSGIQPSGHLCIGNYLGAIKNWVNLQNDYDGIFIVVDLHAITVRQKPAELRKRCLSFAAQYLACGIDPNESIIFIQSHVPAHAELAWILNTFTYMGELSRMTQYKDKIKKHETNINVGLFSYPVLMASDILLYQSDLVPVGEDQKQHLELSRELAERFNNAYSPTFKIPEAFIMKQSAGARIRSLQDPTKKMSKSDENPNNFIALLDDPDTILKKFKRAVTDSETEIKFDENRPGVANLLTLFASLTDSSIVDAEKHFQGIGYAQLKKEVADVTIETLVPIQKRYDELMSGKSELEKILKNGAEEARYRARKTLSKVYRKIGLVGGF